jgi:hypothetical protein
MDSRDAKAHNVAKVNVDIASLKASSAPINRRFDALGLETCGSGSSASTSNQRRRSGRA